MNILNCWVIICFNGCDAMMFLNHKGPLFQYISSYLIIPLILAQACPLQYYRELGAKEQGAVVPELSHLHYLYNSWNTPSTLSTVKTVVESKRIGFLHGTNKAVHDRWSAGKFLIYPLFKFLKYPLRDIFQTTNKVLTEHSDYLPIKVPITK